VFGIAHKFFPSRIRDAFPALAGDAFQNNPQGLNAFLEEYILDLNVFKDMDVDYHQQDTREGGGDTNESELQPLDSQ